MGTHNSSMHAKWGSDPVSGLPGDVAAICLSFLDVHTLLHVAQFVNHAWRDAIDGGLPAIWYDMSVSNENMGAALASFARKTNHGDVWTLRATECTIRTRTMISLSSIRVLHLKEVVCRSFDTALACLHVLEDLRVSYSPHSYISHQVCFPARVLLCLHTVRCDNTLYVGGINNLPALTKLTIIGGSMDLNESWAESVRDITIHSRLIVTHQIFDRIAALKQPINIDINWSHYSGSSEGCHQLSLFPVFDTLQRLTVRTSSERNRPVGLMDYVCAHTSLRELRLYMYSYPFTEQDMQGLSHLSNLQHVKFCCNKPLSSQSLCLLSFLPHLTSVSFEDCDGIADYSFISSYSRLRKLKIRHYNRAMTRQDVQAICQLSRLEKLYVSALFVDASDSSLFCSLRYLREFELNVKRVHVLCPVPTTVLCALPRLHRLQSLRLSRVCKDDIACMVNSLVQMPSLKHIYSECGVVRLSETNESRLREALPRLERLYVCMFDERLFKNY